MNRWRHGLLEITCAGCKSRSKPPVFVSSGGDAYHSDATCGAFMAGRRKAVRCGYDNREIELVPMYAAALRDFVPCQSCYGKAAFATRAG